MANTQHHSEAIDLPEKYFNEIKEYIEVNPFNFLESIEISKTLNGFPDNLYTTFNVAIMYKGKSPTFYDIRIRETLAFKKEGRVEWNDDLFEILSQKIIKGLESKINIQANRIMEYYRRSLNLSPLTTGHVKDILHLTIDEDVMDLLAKRKGGKRKALEEIALGHHLGHLRSNGVNQGSAYLQSGFESNDNQSSYNSYIFGYEKEKEDIFVMIGIDEDELISFQEREIVLHGQTLPEILLTMLPGKKLSELVEVEEPFKNRKIKSVQEDIVGIFVKLEPKTITIENYMKKHRMKV